MKETEPHRSGHQTSKLGLGPLLLRALKLIRMGPGLYREGVGLSFSVFVAGSNGPINSDSYKSSPSSFKNPSPIVTAALGPSLRIPGEPRRR